MKAIAAGSMIAMLAMTCHAQAPADSSPGKARTTPAAEKPKSKDVPKMTPAEKNKMAKDVNKQMVNPEATGVPVGNPLTREVTNPGGRFGVDYYPRNGIVAPKAAPKSPKRD